MPGHLVAELLFGVLHTHPRPAVPHARASSRLGSTLGGPFDVGRGGPGGWVLLDEPELHLGEDVVVPDLAGWRRARMPKVPLDQASIALAPDWICEVLSPSTQGVDRADKMAIYARESVHHAWLMDPIARTLEVYRLEHDAWLRVTAHRDAAIVRLEPFEALEIDLSDFWAE